MKRWPIIRHIRWLYLRWRLHRCAQQMQRLGFGDGKLNEYDAQELNRIWKGDA